jgi:GAF domain-containing protein
VDAPEQRRAAAAPPRARRAGRVATLVARQPSAEDAFAAVTQEAGRVLGARMTALLRVESTEYGAIVSASGPAA